MVEKYGKKVKELMVEEMKDIFANNKGFVFASLDKISASKIDVLRKKIRQSGSRYLLVKNKLADIALKESGIEGLEESLASSNMMGVGVINGDPVQIAKILVDFSKTENGFNIESGYFEGQVMAADRVKELSEMPSRDQLIAMVLGMLNAPIRGFVSVLAAVPKSLLYALNAIKEKKEKSE